MLSLNLEDTFQPISMKRTLFSAIFIIFVFNSWSQVVQWASKVIEFSTELTPIQYSANQALGKPNVLPAGGQNPNAWAPNKPGRQEFLKLGFTNPMSIQQIAIAESHNPSALSRVFLYDEAGKEYEVSSLNPKAIPLKGRMLNVFFEKTPYKVAAIKLEFDGAALPDYFGIDALAITDSNYPVIAFIPTPELLATGIIVEPLDENINSEFSERKPLLSPDGKTLFFSRKNHPENIGGVNDKEDIWYSELGEDGKWQLAKNFGAPLNNKYPNFISSINSITPDGKAAVMVLGNKYLENGKMSTGVSISTFTDGKWSKPAALNITNDYNLDNRANYFLSNSRKTLLSSVKRQDSHGDRDLYVSFMGRDSVWSEPRNLGRDVNTAADESAPFLASDDKTLYFSSKGFSGYGGADIYVTHRLDDTWMNWSEPENLGPEINSPHEDLFFNIPNLSEYAYYSRGETDDKLDIYRAKLPIYKSPEVWITLRGKLVDGKSGKPINAKLSASKLPTGDQLVLVESIALTGEYELKLIAGQLYTLHIEAKDYNAEKQSLDLRNNTVSKIEHKDFALRPVEVAPIEKEIKITLNNVFLGFDQAVVSTESISELNQIATQLKSYPASSVEITGHTCDIGNESYNLDLSKRRALAIQKYLIDQGVKPDRIRVKYFGESQPLVPNSSEENRKKNRRVEIKISGQP